jgi:uncharacterized repeat protein (TIGR03803 family)
MCARSPLRRRLTSIAFGVVSVAGLLVVSSDANAQLGSGTFFKITPSGTLTVLHAFSVSSEGGYPTADLVQATDGNFYGTTSPGSDVTNSSGRYGAFFKITPSGNLTALHAFSASSEGGMEAGLVQATDGNFYGYGLPSLSIGRYGAVFKITPSGTLTVLHAFNWSEGGYPVGGLAQATDGNFYGTTSSSSGGWGTVFKITPNGTLTVLHAFSYSSEGGHPMAGLVQATDGNFYGTTSSGGASGNGTVFKITPNGTLTVLHAFSVSSEGGTPMASLVQATDGNFYGTTSSGGASGNGTVFKITPNGTLTVLHAFSYSGEGGMPRSGLVQATDGNFYGTTCPALVYPDPWLAEHEPIRHRVSVLLGRSEATFQTNFGVQIPAVLSKDGYLVLSGCRPHSCADERAAIFVSISLNVVHCVLIVDGRLSIFSEDSALLPQALVDSWRRKGF